MSKEQAATGQKVSWSTIFSTVATGLLLAAFNYVIGTAANYFFSERADIYMVERPTLPDSKYQKLLVVDNFSSSILNDVQLSVAADRVEIVAPVNFEKFEQTSLGPRTVLIKISGVLPNRQASVLLQSDVQLSDESARVVKGPSGARYKSKDRISESWLDWSQFLNAFIQFAIYVAGRRYFERRISAVRTHSDEVIERFDTQKTEAEEMRLALQKLKDQVLRFRLTKIRQVMSLTRENRLWHNVAVGILEEVSKDKDSARKLLSIILRKAGIKPRKDWEDFEDEELIELVQDAEAELSGLPKV